MNESRKQGRYGIHLFDNTASQVMAERRKARFMRKQEKFTACCSQGLGAPAGRVTAWQLGTCGETPVSRSAPVATTPPPEIITANSYTEFVTCQALF